MNRMNVQKLKAVGVAMLAGFLGCGIMLLLPGVSDSTAAIVGAAAAVATLRAVIEREGNKARRK